MRYVIEHESDRYRLVNTGTERQNFLVDKLGKNLSLVSYDDLLFLRSLNFDERAFNKAAFEVSLWG